MPFSTLEKRKEYQARWRKENRDGKKYTCDTCGQFMRDITRPRLHGKACMHREEDVREMIDITAATTAILDEEGERDVYLRRGRKGLLLSRV